MKKYAVMLFAVSAIAFSSLSFAEEQPVVISSNDRAGGYNSIATFASQGSNYIQSSGISINDLSENTKQINNQKNQIEDLSRKVSGYEQTISQLQRSNDELKRSLDSSKSDNSRLSSKLDDLSRKVDDLSRKVN